MDMPSPSPSKNRPPPRLQRKLNLAFGFFFLFPTAGLILFSVRYDLLSDVYMPYFCNSLVLSVVFLIIFKHPFIISWTSGRFLL